MDIIFKNLTQLKAAVEPQKKYGEDWLRTVEKLIFQNSLKKYCL